VADELETSTPIQCPQEWWTDDVVAKVKQSVINLLNAPLYQNGNTAEGISTQFLMRITLLKAATGIIHKDDPVVREAETYFKEI